MEREDCEYQKYNQIRIAALGKDKVGSFPIELLIEWENVRLKINPNAKPQDFNKVLD